MYINKIEDILDKIIDNFYNIIIIKNKNFTKIVKETNFVKHQRLINDLFIEYDKYIDRKMIKKIICKFGTILTLFWAGGLVLSSDLIMQINGILNDDIFRFLFAAGLIAAGFWFSSKCQEGGTCEK